MKNLIAATAILMTVSFAQADDIYIEITAEKVAACRAELKVYDTAGESCGKYFAWANSEKSEEMREIAKTNSSTFTETDKRRLAQIINDIKYLQNH